MKRRPQVRVSHIVVLALFTCAPGFAQKPQPCHKLTFDGIVKRGAEFQSPITPELTFALLPIATGWRIAIEPLGAKPPHDAAETATPPYQSLSPLLITTDYGFRAQDAVAWNPRQFAFSTDAKASSSASQDEDFLLAGGHDAAARKAAEDRLMALVGRAAHGEFRILDAALVPGTADQSGVAASVASHWRATPHQLLQPAKGLPATPLGSIERIHFQVTLWLPRAVPLSNTVHAVSSACVR